MKVMHHNVEENDICVYIDPYTYIVLYRMDCIIMYMSVQLMVASSDTSTRYIHVSVSLPSPPRLCVRCG